ncbi:MAG TPA: recombinase RecA [bacterium]|nr:recombinase RecA [bacterium]HPS29635.1 recombinase RecA [bacterium]
MVETKKEMLENVIKSVEKQYGKGSIMILGDENSVDIPVIPSGALSLDIAMGVGGYPRGRIVEIYGPESSGKTTLALHAIAEAQKKGGAAAFIDAEHAFDLNYARKLGIQIDTLIVSQPDYAEQALEIAETLVRSNAVDVVVIDSVAALVPRSEIEGEMGDSHMGVQARLMSQALRKLTAAVSKSKTCLIFINQLRSKIGVMFGNPETTTGGNALKFYASMRIDIRKIASIKEKEEVIGNQVKVKIQKNKMFPPFREAIFDIIYGRGIDRLADMVTVAETDGLIIKSGSWYTYGEEKLGQGLANAVKTLKEKPEMMKEIVAKIKEKHNLIKDEEPGEAKTPADEKTKKKTPGSK